MYFKVDRNNCREERGKIMVLYAFYLEPSDVGYERFRVHLPVLPEGGNPNKGKGSDAEWRDALPKKWQDNPFHRHVVYFDPEVTKEEIMFVGEIAFQEAKKQWEAGKTPSVKNLPVSFVNATIDRETACELRSRGIKEQFKEL
jgi:hypothetical protein